MANLTPVGTWLPGQTPPLFSKKDLHSAIEQVREPVHVIQGPQGHLGLALNGTLAAGSAQVNGGYHLMATLPAIYPEWLGDRAFNEAHGVRFPYVAGAMANGLTTSTLVIAMAKAGMLGFFGAAGLTPPVVTEALDEIEAALGQSGLPWGSNLIHSPNEPELEMSICELYINRGVKRVSASAYMSLTPAIVRLASTGLSEGADGRIHRRHFVFAKISRPEVAKHFMSPAPKAILDGLVANGLLTAEEARIATKVPVAEDYIVEADSGGHTDNRTLTALFPIISGLRDELTDRHGYQRPIRCGAAGGLGSPSAIAAAFALGAAFVLTGSVNQSCVESGLCEYGRQLLTKAGMADVMMAPAADMFELGVKVQVLKRGTMFGPRAQRLYETYTRYAGIEFMPESERLRLEKEVLGMPCAEIWAGTHAFFSERDPREVDRAERDPKHRMALIFRWYLGLSSRWAIAGVPERRMDYQIWTGPAIGSFNDWVKGSFLEAKESRTVVQVARNLLEGAAVITRSQQLRSFGVPVPSSAFAYVPRQLN